MNLIEKIGRFLKNMFIEPNNTEKINFPENIVEVHEKKKEKPPNKNERKGIRKKIDVFEGNSVQGFHLVGSFDSLKEAAEYIGENQSEITQYVDSGKVYGNRFKFITRKS